MAAGIPVEADPCMGFRYPSFAFFGIRICRRVTTWHEQCGRFRLNLPEVWPKSPAKMVSQPETALVLEGMNIPDDNTC